MKIPAFWAKEKYVGTDREGRKQGFVASGWSYSSLEEAKREALARAKRVFELMSRGEMRTRRAMSDDYDYGDRPIREEIVREIRSGDEQVALVTRNRYGALVLNTAQVLFADVDFPAPRPSGFVESLAMLFSPKKREAKRESAAREAIGEIDRWAQKNPSRSFRLYRTLEGLRLLFTDKFYEPASEETAWVLQELKADPMYVRLTRKQECFRARLTAKPWRCDCSRPPSSFPWSDAAAEKAYREWERNYHREDAKYRVCELAREFGRAADIPALKSVIDTHDRETHIASNAPLA
ncbi:hypothetical protein JW916_01750 [Candidatus Sumerlaeota bacterium]|nr:hypothetical protein [Candidatus Sumerlaeota bacterium]